MFIQRPSVPLGDCDAAKEKVRRMLPRQRVRVRQSKSDLRVTARCTDEYLIFAARRSRFRAIGRIRRGYLGSRIGKRFSGPRDSQGGHERKPPGAESAKTGKVVAPKPVPLRPECHRQLGHRPATTQAAPTVGPRLLPTVPMGSLAWAERNHRDRFQRSVRPISLQGNYSPRLHRWHEIRSPNK